MMNGLVKSGIVRMGAEVTVALKAANAAAAAGPHAKPSFVVSAVSGAATSP